VGGLARPWPHPIEGAKQIACSFATIARSGPVARILERAVNGQPGFVIRLDAVTMIVMAFEVAGDRITRIWGVRNPENSGRGATPLSPRRIGSGENRYPELAGSS